MPSAFSLLGPCASEKVEEIYHDCVDDSDFSTQFDPFDVMKRSTVKNPFEYFASKTNHVNKNPAVIVDDKINDDVSHNTRRVLKPLNVIDNEDRLGLPKIGEPFSGLENSKFQCTFTDEDEDLLFCNTSYMPQTTIYDDASHSTTSRLSFTPTENELIQNLGLNSSTKTPTSEIYNVIPENSLPTENRKDHDIQSSRFWSNDCNEFGTINFSTNANLKPNKENQLFKPNEILQKAPPKKKHIPRMKTDEELYDDIVEGPLFHEMLNAPIDIMKSIGADGETVSLVNSFEEYGFHQTILQNIYTRFRHRQIMPVQRAAFSLFKNTNNDIVTHAQTGVGKSAAFLLPLINEIQKIKAQAMESVNKNAPYALIIFHTRDLAKQVYDDALAFSKGTLVKPALTYGQYSEFENKKELLNGCDIVICTLGRLVHFIEKNIILLGKTKYLILDEADKLINPTSDFFTCIKFLKENMNPNHRTMMFSATFDEHAEITAREFLRQDYYTIKVGEVNTPVETITHTFIEISIKKTDKLIQLLQNMGTSHQVGDQINYKVPKTIVFVNKKKMADKVAIALCLEGGIKAWSINGDRTQNQREEALDAFQNDPDSNVLVSTEVAARGLNFKKLDLVINYDLPDIFEKFTHRVGRTGRKGNFGQAISFFDSQLDHSLAPELFYMLKKNNQDAPEFLARIVEDQQLSYDFLHEMYKNNDLYG